MATSSFKSNSKRGNSISENPQKKAPLRRRSLSVSATPRSNQDIASEFSNKRDNPLFWSSGSPPDKEIEAEKTLGVSKFEEIAAPRRVTSGLTSSRASAPSSAADGRRGRSVARNSEVSDKVSGGRKELGRSLSRVDTGRRHRSASRGPYGLSESSDMERESTLASISRTRSSSNLVSSGGSKANIVRNVFDVGDRMQLLRVRSSHDVSSPQSLNWEDGASTGSVSEADEKTIKEVCEQIKLSNEDHYGGNTATSGIYETVRSEVRRAISDIQNDLGSPFMRNNTTAIASTNVVDLPPDLVNPGAVELVLDIRREYARKLEESQERARKLRADLAVEEYREQELDRILKETLPDPKTTNAQKPRYVRKTSSERKKMSKRLEQEAMAYFDECVSISTFDSSDFSASEDIPLNSVGVVTPAGGFSKLPQGSPSVSTSCSNNTSRHCNLSQIVGDVREGHSLEHPELTGNSTSNDPKFDQSTLRSRNTDRGPKFEFSFGKKTAKPLGIQQDIHEYIKNFEKDIVKDGVDSEIVESKNSFSVDEYNREEHMQGLLLDRVLFKTRIESGSLHLCGGGTLTSFSPFASTI